jgi:UTP--glucose-1-phosphate uridylyltransferase
MGKIRKAVFPVGGLGTRFLPATKAIPKEMLPVASKPLIQHAFEEAVKAGIEEFVFVTGRNKNAINNHFDHAFELQTHLTEKEKQDTLAQVVDWTPTAGHIAFVPQREPKGLGHAVWCARNFIKNEPFAVILADEMVLHPQGLLAQMVEAYEQVSGSNIIAVAEVPEEKTSSYGILDPLDARESSALVKAKGMVEKPKPQDAPSNLSLTGRYILQPEIFDYLEQERESVGGEIQLTGAMQNMLSQQDFYGLRFEGERFDCGGLVGFLEANVAYSLAQEDISDRVKVMLKKYA